MTVIGMNAEDAGPHVSYNGRLIKQPFLCRELGKPQKSCRWNTFRMMIRNGYFLPPGKDEVNEAGQSLVIRCFTYLVGDVHIRLLSPTYVSVGMPETCVL